MRCHAHHKALNVCKCKIFCRLDGSRADAMSILKRYKYKQFSDNLQVNKIKIMLIAYICGRILLC